MVSVTIESNDEYWLRPFNTEGSIQRARVLFRKGCVANILLGLELMRARLYFRLNRKHNSWYPYLIKIGIDPSTATRRINLAGEFMLRDGIPKDNIFLAFQRISQYPNRALTHGLGNLDIWGNKPEPSPVSNTIFGVSLNRILDKIDEVIDEHRYHCGWTSRDWTEAKEQLEVWAGHLISRAEKIPEYLNKKKRGNMVLDRATLRFRYA